MIFDSFGGFQNFVADIIYARAFLVFQLNENRSYPSGVAGGGESQPQQIVEIGVFSNYSMNLIFGGD